MAPCTKKPFESFETAKRQLRVWQRRGRRAELDGAHAYKADCVEHRGQFHIGRKHDTIRRGKPLGAANRRANPDAARDYMLDELDAVFEHQLHRVLGRITHVERRRQARMAKDDQGALIMPERGYLCPGGDEFDVEDR